MRDAGANRKAISFRLHFLLVRTTKKVTGTEDMAEGSREWRPARKKETILCERN